MDLIYKNKTELLQLVKNNGLKLEFASQTLKADREVAIAALTQNGKAYKFLSPDLQNDYELALLALNQNYRVYAHLINEFRDNKEIIKKIISEDAPYAFSYLIYHSYQAEEFLFDAFFNSKIPLSKNDFIDSEIIPISLREMYLNKGFYTLKDKIQENRENFS